MILRKGSIGSTKLDEQSRCSYFVSFSCDLSDTAPLRFLQGGKRGVLCGPSGAGRGVLGVICVVSIMTCINFGLLADLGGRQKLGSGWRNLVKLVSIYCG